MLKAILKLLCDQMVAEQIDAIGSPNGFITLQQIEAAMLSLPE